MPGSAPARVIATMESPEVYAKFVSDISGAVYRVSLSDRITWFVIMAGVVGIFLPAEVVLGSGSVIAYVVAAGILAALVVSGVDWMTTTVTISQTGFEKRSRLPLFDYDVPIHALRRIRIRAKGSHLLVQIDYESSKSRTFAVPEDQRLIVMRAAGLRESDITPPPTTVILLVSAVMLGTGTGFVGAMIAGPLFAQVSHLVGIVTAIVILAAIVGLGDVVLRHWSPELASPSLRMIAAALTLAAATTMLVIVLRDFLAR